MATKKQKEAAEAQAAKEAAAAAAAGNESSEDQKQDDAAAGNEPTTEGADNDDTPVAEVDYVELPRWRSHKIVQGAKIKSVNSTDPDGNGPLQDGRMHIFFEDPSFAPVVTGPGWAKRFERPANAEHGDFGYYVRYIDGYESWSPSEAFELGYSLDEGEEQ